MGQAVPPRALRESYDRGAARYDERFRAIQAPKHEAVLARVPLREGARVLDAGCGTGLLAARAPGARWVGLDLSFEMLRRAASRVERVQGDVRRLPFGPATFDAAFAITSLLLEGRALPAALVELRRVIVPGGTLALTLLEEDVPAGFARELAAAGFRLAGQPFRCGQDRGFVATRP